jgi:prepilin signal peptidase PulO-like enzyme (type II secretory pathway)
MAILVLIIIGLCIGSFINAFVWRFHEGRVTSLLTGRSECPRCHRQLSARELIPVVSYVAQKGRCANPRCRKPIDDKPWAEVITPVLFVVSYLFWQSPLGSWDTWIAFALWLFYVSAFVALALYDFKWYELPHRIVLPLIAVATAQAVAAVFLPWQGWPELLGSLEGGLIGGGIFYLIYSVSPKIKLEDGTVGSKWIGFGDITLGTLLGILVGGPAAALLLIFVASLLGTLVALPLMALGKAKRDSHLPFGPLLLAAAVIVKLWGLVLIGWYSGLLLS